jgi:hypothetical protein
VAPNSRHGIIDRRRNHRKVKDLIGLVSQFVPLIRIFVSAIRAFQFRPALWKFGFCWLEEVRYSRVLDHRVRKFEIAVVTL